jgi:hypothetical protein
MIDLCEYALNSVKGVNYADVRVEKSSLIGLTRLFNISVYSANSGEFKTTSHVFRTSP